VSGYEILCLFIYVLVVEKSRIELDSWEEKGKEKKKHEIFITQGGTSGPNSERRHHSSSKEKHAVRDYLEPEVTTHSLAKKIRSYQIYQSHIHQNPRRQGIQNTFGDECTRAVRVKP